MGVYSNFSHTTINSADTSTDADHNLYTDDRAPVHARKMTALLKGAGKDVLYYENMEGGHGGSVNNEQAVS